MGGLSSVVVERVTDVVYRSLREAILNGDFAQGSRLDVNDLAVRLNVSRTPVAESLAKRGAKVISVFGASLTLYKGAKVHEELMQRVSKATGMKSTTQSNGLLDGLRTANAKRVALATAYTDEVTERLKIFLQEYGFEVTAAKGLGFTSVPEGANTQAILHKLGMEAYAASRKADALVM